MAGGLLQYDRWPWGRPWRPNRFSLGTWVLGGLMTILPSLLGAPTMPMSFPLEDTAAFRRLLKPVLASRLLDDVEHTNRWSHHGVGEIRWTTQRARDGRHALRLVSPTKPGRPATVSWSARIQSPHAPWVAVIVCDAQPAVRRDVIQPEPG